MSFHGLPCWYELATTNPDKALGFYGELLGWSWTAVDMGSLIYHMAASPMGSVAGMMAAEDGQPSAWTVYFAVDNCDQTAALARSLGAPEVIPPSDIPGTGRFAVLIDPQGAGFALLQPLPGGAGGAFDQQRPGHGNWHELGTPDSRAALGFYGKLFGWTHARTHTMGPDMVYHVIARGGQDIGGTFDHAGPAYWRPYFGAASTSEAATKVAELGGRVVHGPDAVPGGAFTLQVADPEGVSFALVGGA